MFVVLETPSHRLCGMHNLNCFAVPFFIVIPFLRARAPGRAFRGRAARAAPRNRVAMLCAEQYVEDVGATIRRKQRFNKKPWRTRFASGICWLETLGPAVPRPSHRPADLAEVPGSGLGCQLLAAPQGPCARMPEVPGRLGGVGALQ